MSWATFIDFMQDNNFKFLNQKSNAVTTQKIIFLKYKPLKELSA